MSKIFYSSSISWLFPLQRIPWTYFQLNRCSEDLRFTNIRRIHPDNVLSSVWSTPRSVRFVWVGMCNKSISTTRRIHLIRAWILRAKCKSPFHLSATKWLMSVVIAQSSRTWNEQQRSTRRKRKERKKGEKNSPHNIQKSKKQRTAVLTRWRKERVWEWKLLPLFLQLLEAEIRSLKAIPRHRALPDCPQVTVRCLWSDRHDEPALDLWPARFRLHFVVVLYRFLFFGFPGNGDHKLNF